MADNVAITAGSGTSVAADDISSVFHQRVKISLGADGTANDAVAGSGVNGVGVQRVTLATDDAASAALVAMQTATGPVLAPSAATPVKGTTSAMTGTTSTSLLAAPGASLYNYVTTIVVSNSHATVGTDVTLQDGSGGTAMMTIPAAAVYGGAVITLPVPLKQTTANTALYCVNLTTGASTKVSVVGYTGA